MNTISIDRIFHSPAMQETGEKLCGIADKAADAIEQRWGVDMKQVAIGLGWFGVALGAFEILGPKSVRKTLGMGRGPGSRDVFGLRELVTGIGILRGKDKAPWLWGRVGGDVLDLASLTSEFRSARCGRAKLLATTAVVAGIAALDAICARRLSR
jgi:hypothetical protein